MADAPKRAYSFTFEASADTLEDLRAIMRRLLGSDAALTRELLPYADHDPSVAKPNCRHTSLEERAEASTGYSHYREQTPARFREQLEAWMRERG